MDRQLKIERQSEMYTLVEEWLNSSKSKKQFCAEIGIAEGIFYYWCRKYNKEKQPESDFIPINVKSKPLQSDIRIEIKYNNGVVIRVPDNSPIPLLKSLISLQ